MKKSIIILLLLISAATLGVGYWLTHRSAPPPQAPPALNAGNVGDNRALPEARQKTNQQITEDVQVTPSPPAVESAPQKAADNELPVIDADAGKAVSPSQQNPTVTSADKSDHPAQLPLTTKPGIAVLPLKLVGAIDEPQAGEILAESILSQISPDKYTLFERSQIEHLLAEQKFQTTDLVEQGDIAARFGKLSGIRYLILGSLSRIGTHYDLNARIVDCENGQIAQRGEVACASLDEADGLLPQLLAQLGLGSAPAAPSRNNLLPAVNPNARFAVKVQTGDGRSRYEEGEYVSFIVRSERDCYLTIITRDSQGNLTLLLPNAWQMSASAPANQPVTIPAPDAGFRLPIQSPHGETLVKVIATPRPLVLSDVTPEQIRRQKFVGLSKGVKAIGIEPDPDSSEAAPAPDANQSIPLAKLLEGKEWATAELSIMTYAKGQMPIAQAPSAPAPPAPIVPTPAPSPIFPGDPNEEILTRWAQLNGGILAIPSHFVLTPAGLAPAPPSEMLVIHIEPVAQTKGIGQPQSLLGPMETLPVSSGTKGIGDDQSAHIQQLQSDPNVVVLPNIPIHLFGMPLTKYMPVQWALQNDLSPGNDTSWVRVMDRAMSITPPPIGLVDMGLSLDDPRIRALVWTNSGEIPDNNLDDDGDGYVDDVNGFNFVTNTNVVSTPGLDYNHGSMCASIIAGRQTGNPDDVIGIAPHASIIPAVALMPGKNPNGLPVGNLESILHAIDYVTLRGAKVINLSLGAHVTADVLQKINQLPMWDELERRGVILVCAAGNEATDNDTDPVFPACLPRRNIISVMATDAGGRLGCAKLGNGQWKVFTNYGQRTVHLAAPGTLIVGICGKGKVVIDCGTSFAAPMVTATVALVMGEHPGWTYEQIIDAVLKSAHPMPEMRGKCTTSGMLNVAGALDWK